VVGHYGCRGVEQLVAHGVANHRDARVPFIGRGMERSGREAGSQAAADGASSNRRLLEGEATRRPFDEVEMMAAM
jgi:hypothetical protein